MPHQKESNHIPIDQPEFKATLQPFWEKWRSASQAIRLAIPDFSQSQPQWNQQYTPDKIPGPTKPYPYYKLDYMNHLDQLEALRDLVESTEQENFNIILEVGPQVSLTPLTTAGTHEKTIVIALDVGRGPYDTYPNIPTPAWAYDHDYPYTVKVLESMDFQNSAAFFFNLNANDERTTQILQNQANKTQIIAPNSSYFMRRQDEFFQLLLSMSNMTKPGGRLLLVGDDIHLSSPRMQYWLEPKGYRPDSDVYPMALELKNSFQKLVILDLEQQDLCRHLGICDSRFFSASRDMVNQPNNQDKSRDVGVAIFHNKLS